MGDTIRNLGANNDYMNLRTVSVADSVSAYVIAMGDSGAFAWRHGDVWNAMRATSIDRDSARIAIMQRTNYRTVIFDGATWSAHGDGDHRLTIRPTGTAQKMEFSYGPLTVNGDADGGTDRTICREQATAIWRGPIQTATVFGGLYLTIWTNNGSDIVMPEYPLSLEDFLFVSIDGRGKGFATGSGGYFLKTTDNGITWAWVFPLPDTNHSADIKVTDIHTVDSNNAFAVGWSGYLVRTTDGGHHWTPTQIDANLERLHAIAHPADKVYIVCGDYGSILRSSDDGYTWTPINTTTTEFLEGIDFSTPEIGIAAGTSGTILRTTDQGVTWNEVNNILTGGYTSFRQVQAFPSGFFYAMTDSSGLFRSTNQGLTWNSVTQAPQTMGMSFYNEKIGIIGTSSSSSLVVNDSMRFAFTKDGFATAPITFGFPFVNNNRVAFHWLDSNTFLCFGSLSFVVKVDMTKGSVRVTQVSSPQTPLRVFPNPSATHKTTVQYTLAQSGTTTIELWNEQGERVQNLLSCAESCGDRVHVISIKPELHGSFYIHLVSGNESYSSAIILK